MISTLQRWVFHSDVREAVALAHGLREVRAEAWLGSMMTDKFRKTCHTGAGGAGPESYAAEHVSEQR